MYHARLPNRLQFSNSSRFFGCLSAMRRIFPSLRFSSTDFTHRWPAPARATPLLSRPCLLRRLSAPFGLTAMHAVAKSSPDSRQQIVARSVSEGAVSRRTLPPHALQNTLSPRGRGQGEGTRLMWSRQSPASDFPKSSTVPTKERNFKTDASGDFLNSAHDRTQLAGFPPT